MSEPNPLDGVRGDPRQRELFAIRQALGALACEVQRAPYVVVLCVVVAALGRFEQQLSTGLTALLALSVVVAALFTLALSCLYVSWVLRRRRALELRLQVLTGAPDGSAG